MADIITTPITSPSDGRGAGFYETFERADIRACDIMSTRVVTTHVDKSVSDVAKLLVKHKISAVPVMKGRQIVGIVSESDLIRRQELGTATGLPGNRSTRANVDDAKSHGLLVRDVMSIAVKTVEARTPLREIVELMQDRAIRRLLVTEKDTLRDGEKLIGVVSRSDIVRALAMRPEGAGEPSKGDDDIIRFRVIDALLGIPGTSPWLTDVSVQQGVVTLTGSVEDESSLEPSHNVVRKLDHVKEVDDNRTILQPY